MQNNQNISPETINKLLAMAGQKMGTDPMKLKSQLEAGAFEDVIKKMPKGQSTMVNSMLNNPQALQELLNSPKAQKLLKDLMGGR